MKTQQLFLLQELSLWREHKARLENVPRNNVIDSNSLWNMAFYKAQTKEQIIQSGVKPYLVRKYKDELIPLIENRLTVGQKKWPPLRSEEHTSELQSRPQLVCRLLLEKKNHQSYCLL